MFIFNIMQSCLGVFKWCDIHWCNCSYNITDTWYFLFTGLKNKRLKKRKRIFLLGSKKV